MGEKIEPKIERGLPSREKTIDRMVTQVTHRNLVSYLLNFNLPEGVVARAGTVIDIGGGFSSFTEEARDKFTGLRTISIDPAYGTLKRIPTISLEDYERVENVRLDFDPDYRGNEKTGDLDQLHKYRADVYSHFVKEVAEHPTDYVAASHQRIPLKDSSARLVLANNSIIRSENTPAVIKRALLECLRIISEHGEVRIAGNMACLNFDAETMAAELWYNGVLEPGGPWADEYRRTGHYSDQGLMEVFVELERGGIQCYAVIASSGEGENKRHRFDTLILRKDNTVPKINPPESEAVTLELRKLKFNATDGFNIPTEEIVKESSSSR